MMFAVIIEPYDGQFAATLLGAPTIRAVGATRDDALRALHTDLVQGEFVTLEVSPQGGHRPRRHLQHGPHPPRHLRRSLSLTRY
jgi:hypothetical protein